MEDHAHVPETPAKFDRYVERAVFQFHPVRGQLRAAAVSEVHLSPVPEHPPLGQCFVRALPTKWRAVVAAHPWGVSGLHTTSSIQWSSPFAASSVCGKHEMDHGHPRCVGTYGDEKA